MGFFDFSFGEKKTHKKIYNELLKIEGSIMIARLPSTFEEFYKWSQRDIYIRAYEETVASKVQPKFLGSVFDEVCGKCSADDAMFRINSAWATSAAGVEDVIRIGESIHSLGSSVTVDEAVRETARDILYEMKEAEFRKKFDVYGYSAIVHACGLLSMGLTPNESSVSTKFIASANRDLKKYNMSFRDLVVPFLLERKALEISTKLEGATLASFKERVGESQYSTCILNLLELLSNYSGKDVEEVFGVFGSCYDLIVNDIAGKEVNNGGSGLKKSDVQSAEELFKNEFDAYGYTMFSDHCAKVRSDVPVKSMLFSNVKPFYLDLHKELIPKLAEGDFEVPFLLEKQARGLSSEEEDARINAFMEKVGKDKVHLQLSILIHEIFSNIGLKEADHCGVFAACENIINEGYAKARSQANGHKQ